MAKNNKQKSKADLPMSTTRLLIDNAPIQPDLKFRIEEAYKTIRANIMFSAMKKGCKLVVVTSSLPNEGKTTNTVNLAISISQADQRVLLIDGDLRKPKIHQYFSFPNSPGLTNYIGSSYSGKSTTDLFAIIHQTQYENLSVVCSGSIPPNPAELLGSDYMTEFIQDASKDFDYIIIDTPPINIVSDALPLIRESDGVVVVIKSNQSTHPELQKTLASLEFIDAKILGFVVNFAESRSAKGYYKRSYKTYTYGYGNNYGYGNYGGKYSRYSPYKKKE